MRGVITLLLLISSFACFSQSKKDLQEDVKILQVQVQTLQNAVENLKSKIESLENELANLKRQPSSNTMSQSTQQSLYNNSNASRPDTTQKNGLTPKTGAPIYTGPRGCQYYINKNGNKTYIKRH